MAILNIRNLDDADAARIRRAAQARGMTLGEYLGALSRLHENMRALASLPSDDINPAAEMLGALGLGPVTA